MSVTKAQLVSPVGILTVSGINVSGVVTATSFVGSGSGLTGIATTENVRTNSLVVSGISTLGAVIVGTGITANASGINVTGVVTATSFVGSGSGLTGVGPSSQDVTSVAGITTINLSLGNVIYFTHNTDTTVAFANTSTTQEITFIRTKDNTDTPRSIIWPSAVKWPDFGEAPALQTNPGSGDAQTFQLVTRDGGLNWYGWQEHIYFGSGQFLLAWGSNSSGELGQNNIAPFSSPVQIPGTSWSSIAGGANHSLAKKTDNTLWAWGSNQSGRLGQNNTTYFSSPVQIPGTTWSSISDSLAIKSPIN